MLQYISCCLERLRVCRRGRPDRAPRHLCQRIKYHVRLVLADIVIWRKACIEEVCMKSHEAVIELNSGGIGASSQSKCAAPRHIGFDQHKPRLLSRARNRAERRSCHLARYMPLRGAVMWRRNVACASRVSARRNVGDLVTFMALACLANGRAQRQCRVKAPMTRSKLSAARSVPRRPRLRAGAA